MIIMSRTRSSDSDYYHVFISFCGLDSAKFTSSLSNSLANCGVKTFVSYEGTQRGERIADSPFNAIQNSRIAIVVFSHNYAYYPSCLDDLVLISERYKQAKMKILQVFYDVHPSVVKYHTASTYGTAVGSYKLQWWREALSEVADLNGLHFKKGEGENELDLIDKITTMLCNELNIWSPNSKGIGSVLRSWRGIAKESVPEHSNAPTTSHNPIDDNVNVCCVPGCGIHIHGREEVTGDDALRFNSTTLMELCKELQDDENNIIALYGKRGSGKTTLVEAVRDKAISLKFFDQVLFATVSKNEDDWNIQSQIAQCLSMSFKKEFGLYGRANAIITTLSSEKRILVILDDVPEKFDPEKCMGISCYDRRFKFLLTTRYYQNCTLMIGRNVFPCKTRIPVGPLSSAEALRLLQQHSGVEVDKSNQSKLAKEIAFEYDEWFPGSIIEIGCSLRGKDDEEWQGLLSSLRHSSARYQIFLNFRGKDTRDNFTGTLNQELKRKGFKTFMDDDQLKTGYSIPTELIKAIEDSRLSIVVLSENYPQSSWCLEELTHILKCRVSKKQLVWPIFYKMEPKDIERHRTKSGDNSMAKLEETFQNDPYQLTKWKFALSQISKISGMNYREGTSSQHTFIERIVEKAIRFKNHLYIRNMDVHMV